MDKWEIIELYMDADEEVKQQIDDLLANTGDSAILSE